MLFGHRHFKSSPGTISKVHKTLVYHIANWRILHSHVISQFIKSVSPILDFKKVDYRDNLVIDNMLLQATKNKRQESENSIKKGTGIQLKCDFCRGPISGKTQVMKFANFERFFRCTEFRSAYKKKYSGRIEALKKTHTNNIKS